MRNLHSLLAALALAVAPIAAAGCATDGTDATSSSDDDSSLPGSFDLWQASDLQWHFHLKSGNGQILLTSEAYTTRTGAIAGVLSVLENGVDPAQFQVVAAAHGYLIHLVAGNNEIISFSQTYSTKSNATRAVTSCVHAVTTYLDRLETNTSGARVDVELGATGSFHFDLYARNGQVILSSQAYATAADAWNGAYAVQDAAASPAGFQILSSADGKFYFTVTADNGEIVGTSQMYTTKSSAQAGIASVQTTLAAIELL
jgi:hypothetical protein